jgi:hypothetical protein
LPNLYHDFPFYANYFLVTTQLFYSQVLGGFLDFKTFAGNFPDSQARPSIESQNRIDWRDELAGPNPKQN